MAVLTIGGATQDIFLQYKGADLLTISQKNVQQTFMLFGPGEKIELDSTLFFTGGGATNTAVSFKRLDLDVRCCCAIGNDHAGEHVLQDLAKHHIDTTIISKLPEQHTGTSYILGSFNGEKTIFVYRGANNTLTLNQTLFEAIKLSSQLYITSLSHASAQLLPEIAAHAYNHRIPVAINPGISQLAEGTLTLKKSLRHIDILILNSSEARAFMTALMLNDQAYRETFKCQPSPSLCSLNAPNNSPYLLSAAMQCENQSLSMRKFFKAALSMGPKIVVVTNGANGVYAAQGNTIFFCQSQKVEIKNTVGAGDAFGSCFVASLMKKNNITKALQYGVLNSASVLQQLGAKTGLLTSEQLENRLQQTKDLSVQEFELES